MSGISWDVTNHQPAKMCSDLGLGSDQFGSKMPSASSRRRPRPSQWPRNLMRRIQNDVLLWSSMSLLINEPMGKKKNIYEHVGALSEGWEGKTVCSGDWQSQTNTSCCLKPLQKNLFTQISPIQAAKIPSAYWDHMLLQSRNPSWVNNHVISVSKWLFGLLDHHV